MCFDERSKGKGMNQQTLQWSEITETEFDEIPVKKSVTQKASPYDALIQQVIDGSIIAIPVDEKELKGTRIAISRVASKRHGVKLVYRYNPEKGILAIRLGGDVPETDEPKKPVGRPKKA